MPITTRRCALGKQMVRRADALAAIMNCKKGIVVCGMHGKTTTSTMAAHVLRDRRPASVALRGRGNSDPRHECPLGSGGRVLRGRGRRERRHPRALPSRARHRAEHRGGASRLLRGPRGHRERSSSNCSPRRSGQVIYCADDAHAARICAEHPGAISYGEAHTAFYRFDDRAREGFPVALPRAARRRAARRGHPECPRPAQREQCRGRDRAGHRTRRALCAESPRRWRSFRGARRRFEIKYRSDSYMVVDDYGASSRARCSATLATARNTGRKRVHRHVSAAPLLAHRRR